MRVGVLDEQNPLGLMSFMASMPNPFNVIDRLSLPEDAVEPVVHLLLTEELVGAGRAERLTTLQVGPRHLGRRRVVIAWLPPSRYTNVSPPERRVEGEVHSAD